MREFNEMTIPRWALPAALGGVLAIAVTDAVLMRHHPVTPSPRTIPKTRPVVARPSPFEPVQPEIVRIQMLPAPAKTPEQLIEERAPEAVEPARRGRLARVISRIPLLRRWQRHREAVGTEPPR